MDRRRPDTGWRAATFAAALFAITLNFLQPLAHAALMRDGGPMAVSLWTSMCTPSAGQDDAQDSMPVAGKMHDTHVQSKILQTARGLEPIGDTPEEFADVTGG